MHDTLHVGGSGLGHGIPDLCDPDEPGCLFLPAGQSATVNVANVYECIGVHGVLTISGSVTVDHLLVYDDGELILDDGCEIVFADVLSDPVHDPEHFGNGLIVLGKIRAVGQTVTGHVRLAAEVQAGATTLTLGSTPTGWKAGDRLVLPDSRQVDKATLPGFPSPACRVDSQSEVVVIQSIAGTAVTLTTPTQFSHLGAREPDGTLTDLLPHVANLTRSIVLRSANPDGVRGHTIFSQRADVDLRYVEFRDMGRTTVDPVDDTTFDANGVVTRLGTDQKGRYAVHFHHVFGPVVPQANGKQYTAIGLSVNGFKKFGIAVHNTHFGLVDDAVIFDGHGAGLITEDGSETGNEFIDPIIIKVNPPPGLVVLAYEESEADPNARKGNGIWARSSAGGWKRVVVYDTREGMDFSTGAIEGTATLPVRIPKAPGLDTTIDSNVIMSTTLEHNYDAIEDCELVSCTEFGFGAWAVAANQFNALPPKNLTVWHSSEHAVFLKYSDFRFENIRLLNEGGIGKGITQGNTAFGNTTRPSHEWAAGGSIRGFDYALYPVGVQLGMPHEWTLRDITLQCNKGVNVTNRGEGSAGALVVPLNTPPDFDCNGGYGIATCPERPRLNLINVKSLPMPGKPLVTIEVEALMSGELGVFREPEIRVFDHQGIPGNSKRIFFPVTPNTQVVAPCSTTDPEFPGGFVCPIDMEPPMPPPPPAPPTPPQASPNGTRGQTITDDAGGVWTFAPGDLATNRLVFRKVNNIDVGLAIYGTEFVWLGNRVYLNTNGFGWFKFGPADSPASFFESSPAPEMPVDPPPVEPPVEPPLPPSPPPPPSFLTVRAQIVAHLRAIADLLAGL